MIRTYRCSPWSELRKRRDLNPRWVAPRSLSRRVHSAALSRFPAHKPNGSGLELGEVFEDAGEDVADDDLLLGGEQVDQVLADTFDVGGGSLREQCDAGLGQLGDDAALVFRVAHASDDAGDLRPADLV